MLPWLQKFVVTYHESTLWVLDPTTSTVVGVLCLEHKISSIATSGKFVYVLCDGIARPLARFTVHPSFFKNIQKTKVREENDSMSGSGVAGTGEEGRQGTGCEAGMGAEMDKDRVKQSEVLHRERMESEEPGPTPSVSETREETHTAGSTLAPPSSPTIADTATHDHPVHEQPHSQPLRQPKVLTAMLNKFPKDVIKTRDTTVNAITDGDTSSATQTSDESVGGQGSQVAGVTEEVELPQQKDVDSVSVRYHLKPARTVEGAVNTSSDSLMDAIETVATPTVTSDPKGHNSEDCPSAEPVSDVNPSTTDTGSEASTVPSQLSTHTPPIIDPPSVTGPLAMQDLAREVTDLLRPAFGKLSGLMRPQERRKDGVNSQRPDQHSGTTTPRESPVRSVTEEEEEGGSRREGTGAQVEISRESSPKLMLKLSGRLKEKVCICVCTVSVRVLLIKIMYMYLIRSINTCS